MDPPRQSQVPCPRPTAKNLVKTPLTFQHAVVAPEVAHLDASASHAAVAPLRQSRVSRPTSKLIDSNNQAKPALTFQRAAVAAEIARVEAEAAASHAAAVTPSIPSPQPSTGTHEPSELPPSTVTTRESSIESTYEPSESPGPSNQPLAQDEPQVTQGRKHRYIISSDEEEIYSTRNEAHKKKIRKKARANCKF